MLLIGGLISAIALLVKQGAECLMRRNRERRQQEWWNARYGRRFYY